MDKYRAGVLASMATCLLPALLEACVVVGASVDKLQEVRQVSPFSPHEKRNTTFLNILVQEVEVLEPCNKADDGKLFVSFFLLQAIISGETSEPLLLDPEVLHVVAPPFVTRTQPETLKSRVKRRRSFLRKKRDRLSSAAATSNQGLVNNEPATHKQIGFLSSIPNGSHTLLLLGVIFFISGHFLQQVKVCWRKEEKEVKTAAS